MACRAALRSVFATEAWRPLQSTSIISSPSSKACNWKSRRSYCWNTTSSGRNLQFPRRTLQLNCSYNEFSSSSSPSEDDQDQEPPQEAVLKAISEVSKTEGRVGQTTNVIIGGTVTDDASNEWLALDQKVNSYPTARGFTAIGTGGDDFVQAMVVAVESVLQQPIPEGSVKQKVSSRGKYVSVNIGPVEVISSEQVQAVYIAMKRDERMKYFL